MRCATVPIIHTDLRDQAINLFTFLFSVLSLLIPFVPVVAHMLLFNMLYALFYIYRRRVRKSTHVIPLFFLTAVTSRSISLNKYTNINKYIYIYIYMPLFIEANELLIFRQLLVWLPHLSCRCGPSPPRHRRRRGAVLRMVSGSLFKDGIWMSPNLSVLLSLCVYRRTQPLYNFKPISPSPLPPLPLSCCGPIVVGLCGRQAGPQGCPYPGAVRRGSTATGRLSASAAQLRVPHSLPLVFSWSLLSVAVLYTPPPPPPPPPPCRRSMYTWNFQVTDSITTDRMAHREAFRRRIRALRQLPQALLADSVEEGACGRATPPGPVTGTAVLTQPDSQRVDHTVLALLTPMGSDDYSSFLSRDGSAILDGSEWNRAGEPHRNPFSPPRSTPFTPFLESAEVQPPTYSKPPTKNGCPSAQRHQNVHRAERNTNGQTRPGRAAESATLPAPSAMDTVVMPRSPAVVRRGGGIILSEDFLGPRMALVPPPRQAAHDVPCESDSERSSKVKRAIKEVERKVLLAFTMRDSSKLYGSASYRSRDGAARGEAYEERHCHLSVEHSVEESGCVPGAWTPSRVQEGERQASSPASPLLELALPRAALPSHCPGDETHKDPGMVDAYWEIVKVVPIIIIIIIVWRYGREVVRDRVLSLNFFFLFAFCLERSLLLRLFIIIIIVIVLASQARFSALLILPPPAFLLVLCFRRALLRDSLLISPPPPPYCCAMRPWTNITIDLRRNEQARETMRRQRELALLPRPIPITQDEEYIVVGTAVLAETDAGLPVVDESLLRDFTSSMLLSMTSPGITLPCSASSTALLGLSPAATLPTPPAETISPRRLAAPPPRPSSAAVLVAPAHPSMDSGCRRYSITVATPRGPCATRPHTPSPCGTPPLLGGVLTSSSLQAAPGDSPGGSTRQRAARTMLRDQHEQRHVAPTTSPRREGQGMVAVAIPMTQRMYVQGAAECPNVQAQETAQPGMYSTAVKHGGHIIFSGATNVKRALEEVNRREVPAFKIRDSRKVYGTASYVSKKETGRPEAYEEQHRHSTLHEGDGGGVSPAVAIPTRAAPPPPPPCIIYAPEDGGERERGATIRMTHQSVDGRAREARVQILEEDSCYQRPSRTQTISLGHSISIVSFHSVVLCCVSQYLSAMHHSLKLICCDKRIAVRLRKPKEWLVEVVESIGPLPPTYHACMVMEISIITFSRVFFLDLDLEESSTTLLYLFVSAPRQCVGDSNVFFFFFLHSKKKQLFEAFPTTYLNFIQSLHYVSFFLLLNLFFVIRDGNHHYYWFIGLFIYLLWELTWYHRHVTNGLEPFTSSYIQDSYLFILINCLRMQYNADVSTHPPHAIQSNSSTEINKMNNIIRDHCGTMDDRSEAPHAVDWSTFALLLTSFSPSLLLSVGFEWALLSMHAMTDAVDAVLFTQCFSFHFFPPFLLKYFLFIYLFDFFAFFCPVESFCVALFWLSPAVQEWSFIVIIINNILLRTFSIVVVVAREQQIPTAADPVPCLTSFQSSYRDTPKRREWNIYYRTMWMERAEDRERCETRLAQMRRRAELRQLPKPLLPPQDVMDLCEPVEGTAILTENVLGQWQGVLEALTPTERKALHQDPSAAISPAASNRPAVALSAPRRDSNCPSASASATRRQRPAGSPLAFTSVEIQFPAGRPDAAADPRAAATHTIRRTRPDGDRLVFPATPGHLTQAVPSPERFRRARYTLPPGAVRPPGPAPRAGGRPDHLERYGDDGQGVGHLPVGLGPMGSSLGGLSSASSLAFPSASPRMALPALPRSRKRCTGTQEADRRIRPTFRFREAEELYGCGTSHPAGGGPDGGARRPSPCSHEKAAKKGDAVSVAFAGSSKVQLEMRCEQQSWSRDSCGDVYLYGMVDSRCRTHTLKKNSLALKEDEEFFNNNSNKN
eukprot:gene2548-1598_t